MATNAAEAELIRFSHRHSYPPIHTPSLTCHLMLRLKDDGPDVAATRDESNEDRTDTIQRKITERLGRHAKAINDLVLKVQPGADPASLFKIEESASPEEFEGARPRPRRGKKTEDAQQQPPPAPAGVRHHSDTLCLTFDRGFGHFAVGVIAELNSEYAALSFRAWPLSEDNPLRDPTRLKITQRAFDGVSAIMAGDIKPDQDADDFIEALYQEFWDSYFRSVIKAPDAMPRETVRDQLFQEIGDDVGEFQGLVLRAPFEPEGLSASDPIDAPAAREARLAKDAAAYRKQLAISNADNVEETEYREDKGDLIQLRETQLKNTEMRVRHFINDRQSFVSRLLGFRSPKHRKPFNPGNSVMSLMFEGLGAHASTLGGDDEHTSRYLIVYAGPSRHQLGRLVMALHHCGEMRLAGFFDHDELTIASHRIRIQDENLGVDTNTSDVEIDSAEINSIAKSCRGGLSFRVARAAYYAEAIDNLLRDLRVKRIDGWQSYDGFVRRHVLRHVRDVAAVGQRFEALQRRMRQIVNTSTTRHLDKQQARLVKLQDVADILAIGAMTYYAGSVLGVAIDTHPIANPAVNTVCSWLGLQCVATPEAGQTALHTLKAAGNSGSSTAESNSSQVAQLIGYVLGFVIACALRFFYPRILDHLPRKPRKRG